MLLNSGEWRQPNLRWRSLWGGKSLFWYITLLNSIHLYVEGEPHWVVVVGETRYPCINRYFYQSQSQIQFWIQTFNRINVLYFSCISLFLAFGSLVSFTFWGSTMKLVSCFFRHIAEKYPHEFRSTGTYPVAALLPAGVASALTAAIVRDLVPWVTRLTSRRKRWRGSHFLSTSFFYCQFLTDNISYINPNDFDD